MSSFLHKSFAMTMIAASGMISPVLAQDDLEDDLRDLQEMAAREAVIPSCFGDKIRISALIQSSSGVKVGIVETESKASYLVQPGETAGDVEVVSADYDKETVVLKLGTEICTLSLASDPNAPEVFITSANPDSGIYRGEAIENFLRDNPQARDEGIIKFPLPIMPPAVGKGEGIERFLREHPEIAARIDQPVVGKGEGIEKFLREHPEMRVEETLDPTGFGPGIEEQLRLHPEALSNQLPFELIPPEAK